MSAKIDKINREIEKQEKIIVDAQSKLKTLYREKEDTENLEMVDYLRKHKIQPSELKNIVEILHKENGDIIPVKQN